MVRFQPDNWLEAALRPVTIAAPDANVYVEIMAPDFRFLFVLATLVLMAMLPLHARLRSECSPADEAPHRRPVLMLLAVVAVAFVAWTATTGNGRYFLSGLLVVGPLCVGLVWLLPISRARRLTMVIAMLGLQAFAVQQSAPWRAWTMVAWKQPPYFQIDVPTDVLAQPATYATLSAISYSLVAPQFHPRSRWISLHNAPAFGGQSPDARRAQKFLSEAQTGRLMLLVPAIATANSAQTLPEAKVVAAMSQQLARHWLEFSGLQPCRFLASRSLADIGLGEKTREQRAQSGFWLCRLSVLSPTAVSAAPPGSRYDIVFHRLERQCPRFMPAGGDDGRALLPDGEMRSYLRGEMKAYVYDNGEVYYKYYRALNSVFVGKVDDVLSGRTRLDCGNIRGRAGLPWAREI